MRVILTLSHNNREVEYKDCYPEIDRPERKLILINVIQDRIEHEMDLFDVEELRWFPR